MTIAFLGLGRMGCELVEHLIADGRDVRVWNRTAAVAEPYAARGVVVADSAADAVGGADVVMTVLFGPGAVHEVVLDDDLPIATGALWVDVTTVGPAVADESDAWAKAHGVRYVHAPVLGSLAPARNRDLGVLLGGTDADARAQAREITALWADSARVVEYDTAAKAAVGKLVVNLSLAVGMQGLVESLRLAQAGGLTLDEGLALAGLPKTVFGVIAGMKGAMVRDRSYADTQFSTNLLAKDVDLMLSVADGRAMPATTAAFAALEHARRAGHGEDDFASIAD